MNQHVLIVGAGNGLSAALARRFHSEGFEINLACRNIDNITVLSQNVNARCYSCDVIEEHQIKNLFATLDKEKRTPDIVIYNAGFYDRGAVTTVSSDAVRSSLAINALGAFLVAQEAARRMTEIGKGTLLFTGASAGVKGYAQSAPFAMGKFSLRGLCQSLARELAPQNIHVVHFIIDGLIYSKERGAPYDELATTLDPEAIAESYFHMVNQDRSAWTWELELRPFSERF